MWKILMAAAAVGVGYFARTRGSRVHFPWGSGAGTFGFHVDQRRYFDVYKSAGSVGLFWCLRDASGNIIERGWLSARGGWKIESINGVATGRWGYLRRCRRYEMMPPVLSEAVSESRRG